MFDWSVLKHEVPKLVRFCISDLPMYTFFIPTEPLKYINDFTILYQNCLSLLNFVTFGF